MPSRRLPRFHRDPSPPRVEVTPRDCEILSHIQRHRFLRSSHLVSLLGGSPQPILRRLQLLYHAGFLDRPRAQLDYFHQGGSRAIVYGLGRAGATLLKRNPESPGARSDRTDRTQVVGRLFLEHALLISDIMVALEIACRRRDHVRLITQDELWPAGDKRHGSEPFRWEVRLNSQIKIGVIPDQVFGLEFTGPGSRPKRALFFLEADRGTMPVRRAGLSRTSFHRKLLAYQATWTQGIHRTRFGFDRFRVLTVTGSPTRLKTMIDACRTLERGQGLFLFADSKALQTTDDFLAMAWSSGRNGESESVMDHGDSPRDTSKGESA